MTWRGEEKPQAEDGGLRPPGAGDGRAADDQTQNRQPVLRSPEQRGAHPRDGQVTIPFPIPVMEYERTLELLAAMELGARLKRDCRVDELESGFPILKRLEKVGANLDELGLPGPAAGQL